MFLPFISFILCPFSHNILCLSRYTTSYSSTSFTMLVLSYHWWFGYPFATFSMWEWTHCSPWYVSKYHCNYRIRKWSSHTKRGFSPFHLPHTKTSGYYHHLKKFLNPSRHWHYQSDLYRFGATCFDDDITCNDNCHSRQGKILHNVNIKKWFHSLCHKNLRLFPSSFWFLSDFLGTCMYNSPSANLLHTFDVYILL